MDRIDLGDVRAQIDELIERAEAGETVEITRDGRTVARLSGVVPARLGDAPRKPLDIEMFREITSRMTRQPIDGATFIRQMRDDERY